MHKTYHPPATPCNRLLASDHVSEGVKRQLRVQFEQLDPVALLRDIRAAQQELSVLASTRPGERAPSAGEPDVTTFLHSLATAWKVGEIRPTHRKSASHERWWRTRSDPFEHAWGVVEGWLDDEPTATAKDLLMRLSVMLPDIYPSKAQLRTLQRRVKAWRAEKAKDLILGQLRRSPQPSIASEETGAAKPERGRCAPESH